MKTIPQDIQSVIKKYTKPTILSVQKIDNSNLTLVRIETNGSIKTLILRKAPLDLINSNAQPANQYIEKDDNLTYVYNKSVSKRRTNDYYVTEFSYNLKVSEFKKQDISPAQSKVIKNVLGKMPDFAKNAKEIENAPNSENPLINSYYNKIANCVAILNTFPNNETIKRALQLGVNLSDPHIAFEVNSKKKITSNIWDRKSLIKALQLDKVNDQDIVFFPNADDTITYFNSATNEEKQFAISPNREVTFLNSSSTLNNKQMNPVIINADVDLEDPLSQLIQKTAKELLKTEQTPVADLMNMSHVELSIDAKEVSSVNPEQLKQNRSASKSFPLQQRN